MRHLQHGVQASFRYPIHSPMRYKRFNRWIRVVGIRIRRREELLIFSHGPRHFLENPGEEYT